MARARSLRVRRPDKKGSDPISGHDELTAARAALDAGRDGDAMTALVEAWRARRSPALADLVDLLDARIGKPPYANLVTPRADTSIEKLRAVANHDDPRLSTAILGILARPPFIARMPEFWRLVMTIAERLADPRITPLAADLADKLHVRLSPAGLRDGVVKRLRALAPEVEPPTAQQAELEAAIATRLSKSKVSRDREAVLLDEIYNDPTADGPRLVYADVLLERGDPHGELITLQFKRRDQGLSEPEAARERELLKKHMKTWLRGLAPVLAGTQGYSGTRFERGFLAIADMQTSVTERKLAVTWTERTWSTVEQLEGAYAWFVLRHAPLRALRRVSIGIDGLPLFAEEEKFQHVEAIVLAGARDATPEQLAMLERLPALRQLEVSFPGPYDHDTIARFLDLPLQRVSCWTHVVQHGEHEAAQRAFEVVVEQLAMRAGSVAELALKPPFTKWPGTDPLVLVRGARGYGPA